MDEGNKVDVRIHGKEYTLRGVESEEYIQKVAHYIDKKMAEVSKNSVRLNTANTAVLAAINIADDYFKLQQSIVDTKRQLEEKIVEVENYKEELNTVKVKYTQTQLELAKLKNEYNESKKKK